MPARDDISSTAPPTALDGLAGAARQATQKGRPPVHLWDPPFCGNIEMRIAADGAWFYQNSPIGRPALVKLFASILKREGNQHFLVTPVEKVGIAVEDAPFMAVELAIAETQNKPLLHFRTNVDDWVTCDQNNPLRFDPEPQTGGLKPYLHVRSNLWAKVTRSLFFDLVARGEERELDGRRVFGVASGEAFFVMADAEEVRVWSA